MPERSDRRGFLTYDLPAVLYVLTVFVVGSLPVSPPGAEFIGADKIVHLLAFGLMLPIVLRAVRHELPRLAPARQLLLAALASVAAGGIVEVYQAALPHRSADPLDFVADVVGVAIAALIGWAWLGRRSIAEPGTE
jgi:VanZ family protein